MHTSAGEGRFVYELRLVNHRGTGQELQSEAMRQEIRKAACADEKARELLGHQVRVLSQICGERWAATRRHRDCFGGLRILITLWASQRRDPSGL
jgi:hypothetical protein